MQSAGVSDESFVAADHTVAWNNDGDWIASVRQSDGPTGPGITNGRCDFSVGGGFAPWNVAQSIPDGLLKWRSHGSER